MCSSATRTGQLSGGCRNRPDGSFRTAGRPNEPKPQGLRDSRPLKAVTPTGGLTAATMRRVLEGRFVTRPVRPSAAAGPSAQSCEGSGWRIEGEPDACTLAQSRRPVTDCARCSQGASPRPGCSPRMLTSDLYRVSCGLDPVSWTSSERWIRCPAGPRARRSFTEEFKPGAVRLVLDEGKSVGAAARDLDLTESSCGVGWSRRAPTAARASRAS